MGFCLKVALLTLWPLGGRVTSCKQHLHIRFKVRSPGGATSEEKKKITKLCAWITVKLRVQIK